MDETKRMTIEEASDLWDTQSVADVTSHEVEIEYAPIGHTTLVAIEDHLLKLLAENAKKRGVSVETLVNLLLQEKVTA